MPLLHDRPTIEKAPGGRRIPAGAGTDNGLHECNRMVKPLHHENGGLHFVALYGTLEAPNHMRRSNRLSFLPRDRKSIAHASAYISVPEVYPAAVIIGRVQRPAFREGLAASYGPGSVVTLPFFFNPEPYEASHA